MSRLVQLQLNGSFHSYFHRPSGISISSDGACQRLKIRRARRPHLTVITWQGSPALQAAEGGRQSSAESSKEGAVDDEVDGGTEDLEDVPDRQTDLEDATEFCEEELRGHAGLWLVAPDGLDDLGRDVTDDER